MRANGRGLGKQGFLTQDHGEKEERGEVDGRVRGERGYAQKPKAI